PAYLESQVGEAAIERGIANLLRIIDATGCRVILDHHAIRQENYRDRFSRLWDTGQVVTAAQFVGEPDAPLEATRYLLWRSQRKAPAVMPARRLPSGRRSAIMNPRSAHPPAKEGTTE